MKPKNVSDAFIVNFGLMDIAISNAICHVIRRGSRIMFGIGTISGTISVVFAGSRRRSIDLRGN